MPIRIVLACLAGLVLVACDDNGKDQSKHADSAICKGLSEAECTARDECRWDAEKDKCRRDKVDDQAPETTPPEMTDQSPTPEPTPAPETPAAPEEAPAPETQQ